MAEGFVEGLKRIDINEHLIIAVDSHAHCLRLSKTTLSIFINKMAEHCYAECHL